MYFCDVPIETYWGVAKVFACHILELCIQILGKDNNFAICSRAWNFKLIRWLVFPASCSIAQMLSACWVMEVSLSSWQEIDKILAHIHPLPTVRRKRLQHLTWRHLKSWVIQTPCSVLNGKDLTFGILVVSYSDTHLVPLSPLERYVSRERYAIHCIYHHERVSPLLIA